MTLSVHSPDELVAAIPHLLGFQLYRTNVGKVAAELKATTPVETVVATILHDAAKGARV